MTRNGEYGLDARAQGKNGSRLSFAALLLVLSGDGTGGFVNGAENTAQFFGQEGIAVSADGATIHVADGTGGGEPPGPYHRIRKITIGP
jgi:hypothetical protein